MKKMTVLFTIDDRFSPHWQISPSYGNKADAMLDFESFVAPYHKIFSQAKDRGDTTAHELWSTKHDEYWFWISSTPFSKIHVKMLIPKEL